jgi:hypothetical protein
MTKFVIFCIIPFQNCRNQLAANIFSEFTATAINNRELCACFFHLRSLARQITKTQRDALYPFGAWCPLFCFIIKKE